MNPLAMTDLAIDHVAEMRRQTRRLASHVDGDRTPRPMPNPPTTPRLIVGRLVTRFRRLAAAVAA